MKKFLAIILLGILTPFAFARAFSLSPLKYVFAMERGETAEIVITLNNYESEAVALEPAVVGIKTDSQGRLVYDDAVEAINWVKSDWNFINLKEGGVKKVKFLATIPTGVYPGDYYLGVGAKRVTGAGAAVSIGEQLLTLVNLKVAGQAREDLTMDKFEIVGKIFDKNKKFNLEIENHGNVEMPVSAVLKIKNWRGTTVAEQPVNVGNKILPAAIRIGTADLIMGRGFLPGPYEADLFINYGLTKQRMTTVEKFWYVPVWTIALVGVLLTMVLSLVFFKKNRSKL